MIKNYFKIAFRNLWKHKVFSFINIMGLTVGMTACFLIALYVHFESSYDAFNTKSDRIYRLVTDVITPTGKTEEGTSSWAYAKVIKAEYPEVESIARVSSNSFLIAKGNIKFQEENSLFADSTLFKVFDFKMLRGNPVTALKEPYSLVFTESAVKKYFGNSDPIGQTVLFGAHATPAKITAIISDMPENSQIKGDMLVSMSTLTEKMKPDIEDAWGSFGPVTYILLKPGTSAAPLDKKLSILPQNKIGEYLKPLQIQYQLHLEPLKDIYLHSVYRNGAKTGSSINIYTFSVIAVFILLIACINFINLSTARSSERAKEVGVRKVAGALKKQLNIQFILESLLPCMVAFLTTVVSSHLLLPFFNQITGKTVSHSIFEKPEYLLVLFVTSIGMGLLAGIYPAFVLSAFKPSLVLKGRFIAGSKGIVLKKVLVIIQFTVSITMIIATIVVYKQMNFMRSRNLGFDKDQMLVIQAQGDRKGQAFRESLDNIRGVISTCLSGSVPGGGNYNLLTKIEGNAGDVQTAKVDMYSVDFDYINQYKLKLVAGRGFSRDFMNDTTHAMVVNEKAVKQFGYTSPDQIIGKHYTQGGREGSIIGVVKDFNFRSLQEEIKPLTMRIEPSVYYLVSVKIGSKNLKNTIEAIGKKWSEMIPARPFMYFFMDEYYDRQYRNEEKFGKIFFSFSILAIMISCLGLLGLAYYNTIQRTKEIGIRKVLGASVTSVVNLLTKDFLKLVVMAFIIASPVSWYFMHKWLEHFAYQTSIYWWIFILAGFMAFLIAVLTISFQAFRAAIANPVKSLRAE